MDRCLPLHLILPPVFPLLHFSIHSFCPPSFTLFPLSIIPPSLSWLSKVGGLLSLSCFLLSVSLSLCLSLSGSSNLNIFSLPSLPPSPLFSLPLSLLSLLAVQIWVYSFSLSPLLLSPPSPPPSPPSLLLPPPSSPWLFKVGGLLSLSRFPFSLPLGISKLVHSFSLSPSLFPSSPLSPLSSSLLSLKYIQLT
ncbi:hypothetical protein NQD34_008817 [Periophthalmus magnuspinnatus]|nr:hypothetical protein NQD34_008817 [Periophthalmus magnuspinnatus]